MKRTFRNMSNSSGFSAKPTAVLEGYVVAVTPITINQSDKKGRHWTALICDQEQTVSRLTKYLSSRSNCCLHSRMLDYLKSQNGIKLNKLKAHDDNTFTATNETIAAPKTLSFSPLCIRLRPLTECQTTADGEYVSFTCKIVEIGPVSSENR
jgi:hypothetical protein